MIKTTIFSVEVFDEDYRTSSSELIRTLDLDDDFLQQLLDIGLIEPIEETNEDLFFDAHAVQRIHTALRLQLDLNINLEGIALALELLDELHALRERIEVLQRLT